MSGVVREMSEPIPHAQLVNERHCDFAETLAALHELLGSTVTMWVLGACPESQEAAVTTCARLAGAVEFDADNSSPVGLWVGEALLVVGSESLAAATRQEYERLADGARWTVVSMWFRGGARVEIEQAIDR